MGGIGEIGYYLGQLVGETNGLARPTANDFQLITFTFSEPLTDLSFSITDIDKVWSSARYDFIDGVTLTSDSAFISSAPSGSFVTGSGTAGSPWQNPQNGSFPEDGPGGQIDITFTEPVTSFTIRYENLGRGNDPTVNNDQAVFVTRFSAKRPLACGEYGGY